MERVFHAPQLTPHLGAAIKLIGLQYSDLTIGEKFRSVWEADQNASCWGEYEALAPLFRLMPKPKKILEIGPGMGRSLVFFSKKLGWEDSDLHAYEGEGNTPKYTHMGPRFDDSYCGDITALRSVLDFNGVQNVTIFNAADVRLEHLPGRPYDLLYSFYSIGFHWSLEHFLDDILSLLHDRSIAVFTIPPEFQPFPKLTELSHQIINCKAAWPKNRWLKLLILSKGTLPN
jgi:hypothetical protein